MTLPMVTCPLCCRPGFSTSDSLCSALVDVTTRKLCCPICNYVVVGLDKLTIHLFSHSNNNKCGIEVVKETLQICDTERTSSKLNCLSNVVLEMKPRGSQVQLTPNILKLPSSSNSSNFGDNKFVNFSDSSVFCLSGENSQIFAFSPDYIGPSFKNVTINTQNYITNTNITTSTVQTSVVDKVQKRKYSQVFDSEYSENRNNNEIQSSENYSNDESTNSCASTSIISSKTDEYQNIDNTPEKEFESCKDLLTKGDFSTLSDEISELDIKKDVNLTNSISTTSLKAGEDKLNKKEGFNCDLCPIVLPNKTILAMHKQLIHKKVEVEVENKRKLLDCSMCTRTFSLRSSLMIHRKVAHAGGFGNSDQVNLSKETQSKYTCNICGKFFKKEIHLNQHMKAHDEKQWQCTICSKTFTTKYFLKKHRRLHTGETPYKCTKCDKAFTFQQSYHKHLLYHNDEKPYCCAQCGRLFKELSTLHNHERIHSGEKPFTCETCGKAFRQRVSYLVHRRIHTGVLPYKCTACSKSFRYKISQRTHKCPAQPPGIVVRTNGSLVERLQAAMSKTSSTDTTGSKTDEMETNAESSSRLADSVKMQTTPVQLQPAQTIVTNLIPSVNNSESKAPVVPTTSDPPKVSFDRPQVYLLLKGPNEETYYQPLIISQSLGITPNSTSYNLDNPSVFQPNTTYFVDNVIPTTSKNQNSDFTIKGNPSKSNSTNIVQNVCLNSNRSKENIKISSDKSKSPNKPDQLLLINTKKNINESINKKTELFHQDRPFNNNISLDETSCHSQSSTMDEILKELNCTELKESSDNALHTSEVPTSSSNNSLTESNSDMIAMDSNDIFSFILSPDLSSPSDRLGKLTLSPGSVVDQSSGLETFDKPDTYKDNINHVPYTHQDNIFENISDDALKELLFGKSN